jgi:hypothetical protein
MGVSFFEGVGAVGDDMPTSTVSPSPSPSPAPAPSGCKCVGMWGFLLGLLGWFSAFLRPEIQKFRNSEKLKKEKSKIIGGGENNLRSSNTIPYSS